MAEIRIPNVKYGITRGYPERQRTARRRLEQLPPLSPETLELAADVGARVRLRNAQIRRGFVAVGADDPDPPLAEILRSGRGAAVRLKLLLTVIWIAAGRPHTVHAAAQAWATLLGLEDPAGRGARQIRSGLKWLEDLSLIEVEQHRGVGAWVTLKNEAGNGDAYYVPGQRLSELRAKGVEPDPADYYVRLPGELWTRGWIQVMSGPGLAFLLMLLDARRGRDASTELWFSGSVADTRYRLSEDTRGKGAAELAVLGLIQTTSRPIKGDELGSPRVRHVYQLDLEDVVGAFPPLRSFDDAIVTNADD